MSVSKNTPVMGTITAAATALTGTYATLGGVISASGFDQVSLLLAYTKGDETNINFKIQFSDTIAFTIAYERVAIETDSTGVSDCLSQAFKRTTTGNIEIPLPIRGHYIRFQFSATGGTPTGTFGARYRLENVYR